MNLRKIPKVELHRHLELCVRHSTIKELAPQLGIELPNEQAFRDKFLITEPMADLGSVLSKFLDTQKLWSSEEIVERLTFEACEDAFNEGIRVLELRYAPSFLVQGHESLDFNKAHRAVVRGCEAAEKKFKMATGLICIAQRIFSVDVAKSVFHFAFDHRDSFVGVDLADNEVGFDSKPFSHLFEKALSLGFGITVHSGEADVPNAPRYVREAIDYLCAQRIGHGLQIYRDKETMDYVKEKGIVLELCPTSNWFTNAVKDLSLHPFRKLMDYGVQTTINSDDPGIFNIDLTHEYDVLHTKLGFNLEEFSKCNEIALKASFIPEEKKLQAWKNT
ncbi:MAG: adenosine deaminase [Bdellovibrionaceae bacterium]|nr:adenosine deaminase [Pseudobdellovibrionaceae bacterium]